jgi:hypothetical protein
MVLPTTFFTIILLTKEAWHRKETQMQVLVHHKQAKEQGSKKIQQAD